MNEKIQAESQAESQPQGAQAVFQQYMADHNITQEQYDGKVCELVHGLKGVFITEYFKNTTPNEMSAKAYEYLITTLENGPSAIPFLMAVNAVINEGWTSFAELAKKAGLPEVGQVPDDLRESGSLLVNLIKSIAREEP